MSAAFERYIGMDYSGAKTCESSLKGLRVHMADRAKGTLEVLSPAGPRKDWSRKEIAHWLVERLSDAPPTLVRIDHGFLLPPRYFKKYSLSHDWSAFLDDFQEHWPTDEACTYVDLVREGGCGNGAARRGNFRWRRITEIRASAKSVFHFDVPGPSQKSTHAGIPWLRFLRMDSGDRVHFRPFVSVRYVASYRIRTQGAAKPIGRIEFKLVGHKMPRRLNVRKDWTLSPKGCCGSANP